MAFLSALGKALCKRPAPSAAAEWEESGAKNSRQEMRSVSSQESLLPICHCLHETLQTLVEIGGISKARSEAALGPAQGHVCAQEGACLDPLLPLHPFPDSVCPITPAPLQVPAPGGDTSPSSAHW